MVFGWPAGMREEQLLKPTVEQFMKIRSDGPGPTGVCIMAFNCLPLLELTYVLWLSGIRPCLAPSTRSRKSEEDPRLEALSA